jgi:hypothetical protein
MLTFLVNAFGDTSGSNPTACSLCQKVCRSFSLGAARTGRGFVRIDVADACQEALVIKRLSNLNDLEHFSEDSAGEWFIKGFRT